MKMRHSRSFFGIVSSLTILTIFSILLALSGKFINPSGKKEFITYGTITSIEEKTKTITVQAGQPKDVVLPKIENFETYRDFLREIFQKKNVAEIFWEQTDLSEGQKNTRIIWVSRK